MLSCTKENSEQAQARENAEGEVFKNCNFNIYIRKGIKIQKPRILKIFLSRTWEKEEEKK